MSNPNNCSTCRNDQINDNADLHCYIFKDTPTEVCMQHTGRKLATAFLVQEIGKLMENKQ